MENSSFPGAMEGVRLRERGTRPGMGALTYQHSTWEAETELLLVLGQSRLHSETLVKITM